MALRLELRQMLHQPLLAPFHTRQQSLEAPYLLLHDRELGMNEALQCRGRC